MTAGKSLALILVAFLALGCGDRIEPEEEHSKNPEPSREKIYKVVAHRGGYLENALPACSIASLKDAINIHCYASECDIMWTGDGDVVVCHPDGNYMINGLVPSEHTLAEIRAAGKLSNGEQMPSLSDFLAVVTDKGINALGTKLWLDVKGPDRQLQEKVMRRAAEIAKSAGASSLVEMLVPSGFEEYSSFAEEMRSSYGIACAWNGKVVSASSYGPAGWGQFPYSSYRKSSFWPPTGYFDYGVGVSIYHTPSNTDYGNFYADIKSYYPRLKAIFVNHPRMFIQKLKADGLE